jgi:hypothetical protein
MVCILKTVFPLQILAHQLGHLLGMSHDFVRSNPYKERYDKNHKPCSRINGMMDYTNNPKSLWSTCSVEDFENYYSGMNVFLFSTKLHRADYDNIQKN